MYQFKPKSKTFKGNIVFRELDENGRSVSNTIEMEFRRFTQLQLEEFFDQHEIPKDDEGNYVSLSTRERLDIWTRQIQALAVGWDARDIHNEPLPFTYDTIMAMLDENGLSFYQAIWKVVNAGISGEIARKNG